MSIELFDTVALDGARITNDGYLVADARIARTGIQEYHGFEVGKPELAKVRVYRPEAEVFARDTMASLAHRPMTNDHPPTMVTADNWSKYAIGQTGDEVVRDGDHVRVPLTLMDADAIKDFRSGKRELSVGYHCDLSFETGTTPQGEAYDAVQRNIRGNHLALVDAARAGQKCRIGDKASLTPKDHDMTLKTLTIDGITVEMSDTAVQVVSKLQTHLGDAEKRFAEMKKKADEDEAEAKKKCDSKDGEIAALKARIPDAKALDSLIAERSATVDAAKKLLPALDAAGKSIADIRRAAVVARLGDAAVKDKSDDYVAAAFDTLLASGGSSATPGNPLAAALADNRGAVTDANKAYSGYLDSLTNAWKGDANKGAH